MKQKNLFFKITMVIVLFCVATSGVKAVTNNVELLANGDFSTNVTPAASVLLESTAGVWYVGDNSKTTWNTVTGFYADATTGGVIATNANASPANYDNFLGQITSDATINTGRYRFSINASGDQPFYIKISAATGIAPAGNLGTESTYVLKNASSASIEKQSTPDCSGYSLKITPTGTATTYYADLDLQNGSPSAIRVFIVFPKVGSVTVDDISLKRTADIPSVTTFYIRPENSTAWNSTAGVDADQIITGDVITISGSNTYYIAAGNYTTGGMTVTSGKIYGGFKGDETSNNLSGRATSDLDGNGIIEPWEFTNETSIKSSLANSSFTGSGTSSSRLLVVSGNGGEVNGVTLSDFSYSTYAGPIYLGKPASTPVAADTVSTLAGTLRFCTVRKIKSAVDGAITISNPYSLVDRCLIENTVNTGANNTCGAINMKFFGGLVEGCVIRNNVSSATSSRGGAICISTGSTTGNAGTVRNCLIYNNASTQGGAIRIDGQAGKRGVQIINCTIANNKSGIGGGSSPATVELINCGLISNSIIVNPALSETGTEIRANTTNSYIANTVYGDSTYTAGGSKSGNLRPKITSDLGFSSPTTFSGVAIEGYTTPWDATAIANYNAIRQANFTITNVSSPSVITAGLSSLPSTYSYTTGTISITTTVPTTDITGFQRTGNYTLGAYQATLNVATGTLQAVNQNANLVAVTVAAGGQLTLNSGKTLTAGTFTLQSDASGTGTFVDGNAAGGLTVTGTTTVNQSLGSQRRTWYLSSPVANAQPAGMDRIKSYNEANNTWPTLFNSGLVAEAQVAVAYQGTFEMGKGYLVVPSLNNSIAFTGALNAGEKLITLKKTTDVAAVKTGFNLIGNPYPSYLSWSAIFANTANAAGLVDGTMWYRTKEAGEYKFLTVNGAGVSANGASNSISPMQAFWVRASTNNSILTLNKDMRSHAPLNNKLLKAPVAKNDEMSLVRLQVSNGVNTDEAVIYFSANASNGRDAFDAPKMSNENAAIPEIYTTLGAEHLVINGMNTIPLGQEIGLGFVAGNATTFSLQANEVHNLPADVKLILKDNATQAETDVTDGVTTYAFTPLATTGNRFSVIFRTASATTDVVKLTDSNNLIVYSKQKNQITLVSNDLSNLGAIVSVYNAVGQKLLSKKIEGSITLLDGNFTSGVYVVKVNSLSQKVIVK